MITVLLKNLSNKLSHLSLQLSCDVHWKSFSDLKDGNISRCRVQQSSRCTRNDWAQLAKMALTARKQDPGKSSTPRAEVSNAVSSHPATSTSSLHFSFSDFSCNLWYLLTQKCTLLALSAYTMHHRERFKWWTHFVFLYFFCFVWAVFEVSGYLEIFFIYTIKYFFTAV